MKKNIGKADRLIRLLLAVIIGLAALFIDVLIIRAVFIILSLFIFYEALAGWCALYALMGKNTCPINYKTGKEEKK
jgi:hypothetical protein